MPRPSTPSPGASPVRAVALALAILTLATNGHAADSGEMEVRAAYLIKLVAFVDWPIASFAGPADPFAICIVGKDPFGPLLDKMTVGQKAAGRPMVVRRMPKAV
ncbi:MAG TPA: YfiR family protein, partial [Caulobacteraceae bacterium]